MFLTSELPKNQRRSHFCWQPFCYPLLFLVMNDQRGKAVWKKNLIFHDKLWGT
jgi:hypothetical protein